MCFSCYPTATVQQQQHQQLRGAYEQHYRFVVFVVLVATADLAHFAAYGVICHDRHAYNIIATVACNMHVRLLRNAGNIDSLYFFLSFAVALLRCCTFFCVFSY